MHPARVSEDQTPENYKLTAPGYMRMVRNAVDRFIDDWNDEHLRPEDKMTKERFCESIGLSTTHFYRIIKGRSSIKRAVTLYESIRDIYPDIWLPPPAYPISSRAEYRWCRVGSMLMAKDPARWEQLMEAASKALDHADQFEEITGVRNRSPLKRESED